MVFCCFNLFFHFYFTLFYLCMIKKKGLVPSVATDPNGRIKPGQDQIKAVGATIAKMKKRADAKKKGVILDEAARGVMELKAIPIQAGAELRIGNLKVARDGNRYFLILMKIFTGQ